MKNIRKLYNESVNESSDINEHLPVLKKYGSSVEHITEFGVRGGNSTTAFLASEPEKMISFDIKFKARVQHIVDAARKDGINYWYILKDVLGATIEPTDLLFIDTKHTYNQLKAELALFNEQVSKYIILHDTVAFGYTNEVQEGGKREGLMPAIDEFLQQSPSWEKHDEYKNNNGLLVLKRNG